MTRSLRRNALAATLFVIAPALMANQDLSVVMLTQPLSGCALSTTEPVRVHLFNQGDSLPAGTTLRISYSIDDGEWVSEGLTLMASLASDRPRVFVFKQLADLSRIGPHTVAVRVELPGDINPNNNLLQGHEVEHWAPSAGGNIFGPSPAISGTLTLSNQIGKVLQWQQNTEGSDQWRYLEGKGTTAEFDKLTRTTQFRAEVQNGNCAAVFSKALTVTPN